MYRNIKLFYLSFLSSLLLLVMAPNIQSSAQGTMIPLPNQTSAYTGMVRGMWFISPVNFTIIGLRVPSTAGTGTQSIQVMKIHSGGIAVYSALGTNFTNLFYANNQPNNVILPVNIPIKAGDTLGILGQAGTATSYGSTGPYTSSIAGMPVTLGRFLYQGNITAAPAPEYSTEASGNLGMIEVYYEIAPPDNAGVSSLESPRLDGDFCTRKQEVKVKISNNGKNKLNSVRVNWSVNGVNRPSQNLTFNPALDSISGSNRTRIVTLGEVDFPYQTPVNIVVWTSMPNGVADTDPEDDTLSVTINSIRQGVSVSISPREATICPGESIIIDAGAQDPGTVFIWNNGSITQKTLAAKAGVYKVYVQSSSGCTDEDSIVVTVTDKLISGDFGSIDQGNNLFEFTPTRMQNVTYYHWDFGDSASTFAVTDAIQQHRYKAPGVYVVALTGANACDTFTIKKQIFVHPEDPTGIEDSKIDNVQIYPNPVSDYLRVEAKGSIVESISIFNAFGQNVYQYLSADKSNKETILDLKHLPNGIYHIVISTNAGTHNKKLNIAR